MSKPFREISRKPAFGGIRPAWEATLLLLAAAAISLGAPACTGNPRGRSSESALQQGTRQAASSATAVRRLSRDELDNTIHSVFEETQNFAATNLPEDPANPFDNDTGAQIASAPLIEGLETIAQSVASSLLADTARRNKIVGCTPSGSADSACMKSFLTRMGRRLLRRPLTADETSRYQALAMSYAASESNFYAGVDVLIRALLQNPEFVYRMELGKSADGGSTYRLNDYEIASKLSFFLLGTTPDESLLDLAASGGLSSADGRIKAATSMLADPRAIARFDRFHALWLGYSKLPHPAALSQAMLAEANAMVNKVVFTDNSSWFDLLTGKSTYIDSTMASVYGLSITGGPQWVVFPADRQGILSTGAFLSVAGKFGDTSPTQRGKLIRERLLCQAIPPPPPTVNVDQPPTSPDSSPCKWNRYAAHRQSQTSCLACHQLMDPVGFGLENYDQTGKLRSFDLVKGVPDSGCPIAGNGEVVGTGTFHGPAQLSDLLIKTGQIEGCLVQQVFRFAMGHKPLPGELEYLSRIQAAFKAKGSRFKDLLLSFIGSDEFATRIENGR